MIGRWMSHWFCWAVAVSLSLVASADGKSKAAEKWVEHDEVELAEERQTDGDSFGMWIKTPKGNRTLRTYRLYGVDSPESDAKDRVLAGRIAEQAKWFGCKPEEIPAMGKKAAAFTEKLLRRGKPRIITRGVFGQKVDKSPGRNQRYYALVEVTAADGKRRMLHELLLEAGYARAYGTPAAWPPEEEDRRGEKEACERFMEDLKRLERAAKREKAGVWEKAR